MIIYTVEYSDQETHRVDGIYNNKEAAAEHFAALVADPTYQYYNIYVNSFTVRKKYTSEYMVPEEVMFRGMKLT